MNQAIVRDVMDLIAQGYGSTPTGLDRAIASNVVNYFYEKGWMSAEEIAILVKAAGGEIKVTENLLTGEAPNLYTQRNQDPFELIFRSREKVEIVDAEELTKNAKVNPEAEKR